jgi:hypothetical protein
MKKLIFIIAPVLMLNYLSGQDYINLPFQKDSKKSPYGINGFDNMGYFSETSIFTKSSDTLWFPGIHEIHEWSIDHYYLKFLGCKKYNTDITQHDYGKLKSHVGIDPITKDSTYKLIFTYHLNGKHEEIITQNYDLSTNEWLNSSITTIFYDQYNYDSVTLVKTWNSQSGEWVNSERTLFHRNEMEAIVLYATEIWQGANWYRHFASKLTYYNSEYGCTDSVHEHLWVPDINFWRHYRIWRYEYDEDNILTTSTEVYFDQSTNKWTNYLRGIDHKFKNWTDCIDLWRVNMMPCHVITLKWIDTSWVNYRRASTNYDSLGGREDIIEYFNGIDWYPGRKIELRFLENGNIDFLLKSEWNGEKWVPYDGYKSEYNYVNDTLVENYNNRWNPDIMNWGPYFLYKYKNYIGLPLVSSVGETKHMQSGLVKLTPNPAGETVKVELHSETDFISEVQIIDQQGRTVTVQSLDNTGSKAAWVNISHLGKGLYIVETSTQQKAVYYYKLIKH